MGVLSALGANLDPTEQYSHVQSCTVCVLYIAMNTIQHMHIVLTHGALLLGLSNKKMAVRYILGGGKKPRQTPTELSIENVFGLRQVTQFIVGLWVHTDIHYKLWTRCLCLSSSMFSPIAQVLVLLCMAKVHSTLKIYWYRHTAKSSYTIQRRGKCHIVTLLMSPNAALCSLVTA